jgi:hypothetical protein
MTSNGKPGPTDCCNHPNRHIDIATSDATLTCVYCPKCEGRQWFRDGQPVTIADITDTATREWNRSAARS